MEMDKRCTQVEGITIRLASRVGKYNSIPCSNAIYLIAYRVRHIFFDKCVCSSEGLISVD